MGTDVTHFSLRGPCATFLDMLFWGGGGVGGGCDYTVGGVGVDIFEWKL